MYLILRGGGGGGGGGYEGDAQRSLLCARIIYYRHRLYALHPLFLSPVIMACNSVITARAILNYGVT